MLVRNVLNNFTDMVSALSDCDGWCIIEKGCPNRYFESGQEDFIKQEFGNRKTFDFALRSNLINGRLRYVIKLEN